LLSKNVLPSALNGEGQLLTGAALALALALVELTGVDVLRWTVWVGAGAGEVSPQASNKVMQPRVPSPDCRRVMAMDDVEAPVPPGNRHA
jgi:hypothetical protein